MSSDLAYSDPSDRATDLFFDVLDLSEHDRADYLRKACAGDQGLLAEVEALLEEDARLDHEFIEVPAPVGLDSSQAASLSPDEAANQIPERIGHYRVREVIGSGGMGQVLLAEQQEPVQRKVAIKILKGRLSQAARGRFARESQALARLNHPNIASLFEVGELDEPNRAPFIAMEWVDGAPITSWCDGRQASIETRLRLFVEVCEAISHAHRKQILHCDIKPSNVLVTEIDDRPSVRVIDFGIARALSEGSGSASAALESGVAFAGSPLFMSPEAAGLGEDRQLDTRSDVYSLGSLLFRLLVGVMPHDAGSPLQWALEMREDGGGAVSPAVRLRGLPREQQDSIAAKRGTGHAALARRLRGDLSAILDKARADDPDRRYESPSALADDVGRHLRGLPVRARAGETGYVVLRVARRNWKTVLAITSLIAALALGLVGRTIEAQRATAEAERANAALRESEEVREFVVGLLNAADPEGESGGRMELQDVLARGVSNLEDDLQDQPLARARFLQTIASIYNNLSLFPAAEHALEIALSDRLSVLPAQDPLVLETRSYLGVVLRQLGRYDEASPHLEEVLAGRRNDPDVHPERLAISYGHLGSLRWAQQRFDEAEKYYLEALAIREQHEVPIGGTAEAANNLGVLLLSVGRPADALTHFRRARELFEQMDEGSPRNLASTLNNIGLAAWRTAEWKRAPEYLEQSLVLLESTFGPDSPRLDHPLRSLVGVHSLLREWEQADRRSRRLVALARSSGSAVVLARALRTAASYQLAKGDAGASLQILTEAEALLAPEVEPTHPERLRVQRAAALTLSAQAEHSPAVRVIDEVMQLVEGRFSDAHPQALESRLVRLQVLSAAGHHDQIREEGMRLHDDSGDADAARRRNARFEFHFAEALLEAGQPAEALPHIRHSLELNRGVFGDEHPQIAEALDLTARIQERLGNSEEAVAHARQALHMARSLFSAGDEQIGHYRRHLATLEGL